MMSSVFSLNLNTRTLKKTLFERGIMITKPLKSPDVDYASISFFESAVTTATMYF